VTGYDANGAPAILSQGTPPTVIHAGRYTTSELWVSDRAPITATDADTSTREWELEPPPGGACFRIVEIAPGDAAGSGAGDDNGFSEFQGTHATNTLDYVTILRGEVTLIVGDASAGFTEVLLQAGDSVVQQPGVPHDWQNRSGERAIMIGVLVSAVSSQPR
jgi:hypothetical protein